MPAERYQLKGLRIGALPILNGFIARMGLEEELTLALRNAGFGLPRAMMIPGPFRIFAVYPVRS
jgi:hypothetical protein